MRTIRQSEKGTKEDTDIGAILYLGLIGVGITVVFFIIPELIKYCWVHRHEIMDYIMSLFYNSHY